MRMWFYNSHKKNGYLDIRKISEKYPKISEKYPKISEKLYLKIK